jgi:hypothetical protein
MDRNERQTPPEDLRDLVPDLRYDSTFKAVFADDGNPDSRAALSGLLTAVIGRALSVERILQNEPKTEFSGEKHIRYIYTMPTNRSLRAI